jgi:hypothetical protein
MKRILMMTGCFIALTCVCFAQDVIVTKDSRKINAKVTEVNVDDIKYKNFDNQEGPTYTLPKSEIASILYQDGKVETFKTESATAQAAVSSSVQTPKSTRTYYSKRELAFRLEKEDPILFQQYKSGKRTAAIGRGLFWGGMGVAAIGGIWLASIGHNYEDEETGVILIAGGSVSMLTGIPVMIIGGAKKRRALNLYHRRNLLNETTPHFQLNMHGNGLGLAYVF